MKILGSIETEDVIYAIYKLIILSSIVLETKSFISIIQLQEQIGNPFVLRILTSQNRSQILRPLPKRKKKKITFLLASIHIFIIFVLSHMLHECTYL